MAAARDNMTRPNIEACTHTTKSNAYKYHAYPARHAIFSLPRLSGT